MKNSRMTVRLVGLGSILCAPFASAALFVHDGFDYTANDPMSGQNGGTGFAGGEAWNVGSNSGSNTARVTVADSGLSYGPLLTSGNALEGDRLAPATSVAMFRDLGATYGGTGSDLWITLLVDSVNTTGISLYNGSTENTFFGPNNSSGYGTRFQQQATVGSLTLDTTKVPGIAGGNLLVVRLDMTTGGAPAFTTWVNPDFSSLGTGLVPTGGTAQTLSSNTANFSFDKVRAGFFSTDHTGLIDELRIGDTWASVSPVPEPSGVLLLGLGGLLGLTRRRR